MATVIEFPDRFTGRAQRRRPAIEAMIERFTDVLDAGDAVLVDLEPGVDDEDSVDAELESWTEWHSQVKANGGRMAKARNP